MKHHQKHHRAMFLREAGEVRRLHTAPIIGEYNIATHVYNMLAILRILYPSAPAALIWAIMEHDVAERLMGDIPSPAIHFGGFIDIKAMDSTEDVILDSFLISSSWSFMRKHLDDPAQDAMYQWVKALDIVELWLTCRDHFNMGNRRIEPVLRRCEAIISSRMANFPKEMVEFYNNMKDEPAARLEDMGVIDV